MKFSGRGWLPGTYPHPERAESKKNVVLVRHLIVRVPLAESMVPPPPYTLS